MVLDVTMSADDFIKGMSLYYLKIDRKQKNRLIPTLVLGVFLTGFALFISFLALFTHSSSAFGGMAVITAPTLLLGLYFIYVYTRFPKKYLSKWQKNDVLKELFLKEILGFTKDGIFREDRKGNYIFLHWDSISRFYETKDFFVYTTVAGSINFIPKFKLSDEEVIHVKQMVEEYSFKIMLTIAA